MIKIYENKKIYIKVQILAKWTVLENYKLTVLSNSLNWNSDFYSFAESSVIEGPHSLICNEILTEFRSQSRMNDIKFIVPGFVIMADSLNTSRKFWGGERLVLQTSASRSPYNYQSTLTYQLIKPNLCIYSVNLLLMQNHSFYNSLETRPSFIC